MKRSISFGLVLWLVAACLPQVPNVPPNVQVPITVVSDEEALENAVAEALTSTVDAGIYATETALAEAGITLTPSVTPTITPSPTVVPTNTPTLSPTPTLTVEPSATILPTNTPNPNLALAEAQVRVINALPGTSLDIYFNDVAVVFGLEYGGASHYLSFINESLRLRTSATADTTTIDQLVNIPQGSSLSIILANLGTGPQAYPILEDVAPLPSGQSRLMMFQANPDLIRFDLSDQTQNITLLRDFDIGDVGGPFDLPSGLLSPSLVDSAQPDLRLTFNEAFTLATNVSYLAIFVPQAEDATSLGSDLLLFESATRMNPSDIPVRFINAAPAVGAVSINVNGFRLVNNLPVGEVTVPLPVADLNVALSVSDINGSTVLSNQSLIDDETVDTQFGEKLIVIYDRTEDEIEADTVTGNRVAINVINRAPRVSSALTNLRLIHALTGATNTLDLEIRSRNPVAIDNPIGVPGETRASADWVEIISEVGFGEASGYVTRALSRFDARVKLSSSGAVQSTLNNITVVPGASYDLIVLPGQGVGVTRILVLQPDPQISLLAMRRDDPELVEDRINATLTALAPQITQTAEQAITPTPTISPVPTNTPRPSNTPPAKPAAIQVNPAPPNAVRDSFIVSGEGLESRRRFTININESPDLLSGQVNEDGTIAVAVNVPADLQPGPHTVRVCVDCRLNGAQQEAFAVFIVADPSVSPTPTPQP